MIYLDLKYLSMIKHKLIGFTQKKDSLFNARCPICGDSNRNKNKKRFYIYPWKNDLKVKCHNCHYSGSFGFFLKDFDPYTYDQYRLELFREKYGTSYTEKTKEEEVTPPQHDVASQLVARQTNESIFHKICMPLKALESSHAAIKYCQGRGIPKFQWSRLYAIADTLLLKQLVPDLNISKSESRLVLPFFDGDGSLVGMTCRSLEEKAKLRYLTIKLNDTPQIFGMDKLDPSKPILVVEGPIDSLFLPNCIAVTGTSFGKVKSILSDLGISKDNVTLIIDNQPRNKEVVKIVERLIMDDFSLVIWDTDEDKGKDINAMISNGMTPKEVYQTIRRCTCKGLDARMRFMAWKKTK